MSQLNCKRQLIINTNTTKQVYVTNEQNKHIKLYIKTRKFKDTREEKENCKKYREKAQKIKTQKKNEKK